MVKRLNHTAILRCVAASSQQPVASNQQPATSSQQPAQASINEYLPPPLPHRYEVLTLTLTLTPLPHRYEVLPQDVFSQLLIALEKSSLHAQVQFTSHVNTDLSVACKIKPTPNPCPSARLQDFNMNMQLRTTLWNCGFMDLHGRKPSVDGISMSSRGRAENKEEEPLTMEGTGRGEPPARSLIETKPNLQNVLPEEA